MYVIVFIIVRKKHFVKYSMPDKAINPYQTLHYI